MLEEKINKNIALRMVIPCCLGCLVLYSENLSFEEKVASSIGVVAYIIQYRYRKKELIGERI